jgi:hypothetical protein
MSLSFMLDLLCSFQGPIASPDARFTPKGVYYYTPKVEALPECVT